MASVTVTIDVPDNSTLAKAIALKGAFTVERVVLVGLAKTEGENVHFHQIVDGVPADKVSVSS